MLSQTSIEREAAPFALGGFSAVYKATFDGSPVVMKILKVAPQTGQERLCRVSNGICIRGSKQSLILCPQLLAKEVVGWKWLRHDNILPFLGVLLEPPLISIVSRRMEHGCIMNFIRLHPTFNRLQLVSKGRDLFLPLH